MNDYKSNLLNFTKRNNLIVMQSNYLKEEIISSTIELFNNVEKPINFVEYEDVIYLDKQYHVYGLNVKGGEITLINSSEVLYLEELDIDTILNLYDVAIASI